MNKVLKAKWLAALRSGEFKQERGTLHQNGAYCCLGVAFRVCHNFTTFADGESDSCFVELPLSSDWRAVLVKDGLDRDTIDRLASMNDRGKSFAEIADYIDAHIPADEAAS